MLPESEREIYINLTFKSSKTELLEGLDALLNLGLIDEKAVADIARNDLSCLLPERKPKPVTQDSIISLKQPSSTPEVEVIFINENRAGEEEPAAEVFINENRAGEEKEEPAAEVFISENREDKEEPAAEVFINENREDKEEPEEAVKAELFQSEDLLNILFQVWQSLKDEFSIRWLLFLGVFLVMVSSGVLAATQWQRFPAAGQYLILWSYTLVFWGTTFWAAKQDSLQLTTRTLETIALSLIPLNFWAIDSLNLWNNFVGWLVIAIAAFSLTAIYLIQNQQKQNLPLLLNFLLLSYLHWGWSEPNLALIAVHIGAIGTTFTLSFLVGKNFSENSFQIKLNRGLIIFALAVLLIRAIFISAIPIQELALAIGLCGWLLTKGKKLAKESLEKNLAKIGTILLFIAWLVSIKQPIPWQATLISILAIEYCFRQLQQNWLLRDLLAIFAIGLQTYLLLGYLIPPQLRSSAIAHLVSVTNSSAYPEYTLYSMSLFPYLLCCLGMTNWLYRKKKTYLAIFGEWVILIFGIFLTGISFANPIARSLNLFLSTATLFYVSIRRTPTRVTLVYLTHILGIGTIAASIDYWFPNLSTQVWANILIALMAIEWIIFTGKTRNYFQKIWQESCWYFGLALAAISYILLLDRAANFIFLKEPTFLSALSWLLVPITLTIVAIRVEAKRKTSLIWLSSGSAIAVQLLTIWQPPAIRLFSLSVANVLMLINTSYGKKLNLAKINIGFALTFILALVWERISLGNLCLLGAIELIILWVSARYLGNKKGTLATIYSKAADCWGYFICISELSIFTLNYVAEISLYFENTYTWQYLAAPILIGSAILYRSQKDRIINIIWLLGLCASATLMLTIWQPTAIKLLAVTVATGLMLVNSRNSQNQELFPIINLGWGIGFVAALFWEEISGGNWYLLGAIAIIILWSFRKYLLDKNGTLTSLYSQAADGWAYFLCIMELSIFTLTQIQASYFYLETNYTWQYVAAPILIGSAILYRSEKDRIINIIWLICLCASATLMLTIWQPTAIKLFGLAVATDLMLVNSRVSQNVGLATLNIGWAIGLIISLFWGEISLGNWYLLGAIAIIILSGLRRYLIGKNSTLASIYSEAADRWNSVICIAELSILTLNSLPQSRIYLETNYTWQYLAAPILIGSAIAYLYWQKPNNQSIFCVAWAIESAVTGGILIAGGANLEIATANICLALLSLLLTRKKYRLLELSILQFLPIIYVLISIAWRWNYFTAQTGWLTLAAAVITILAASRYMKLDATKNTDIYSYGKIISYLCIAGITFGCYELVIYRMMQSSGGSIADAITILAMVAAAIALFYRLFVWFWRSRDRNTIFQFTLNEITIVAHLHWVLASILKILAGGIAVESDSRLFPLSIAVSFVLAAYALIQGRDKTKKSSSWWVYVGIVEIIATTIYARLVLEQMSIIDPWRVIIVCLVALFIYQLPWQNLGWHPTPWHRTSLVLPAASAIVTVDNISYLSLLAVAVFYGRIAISQKNIRWSYLSLSFLDGAIARFGLENNLTDILFYVSIIGFSLLYIAQFDPILIKPKNKQSRHYLRILGIGIVCFVALIFHQDRGGIVPSIISLMVIFAGLGLKVRAFLFVGTITFLLTVFYHLIVLSVTYAFLKWVIGLIAGIILIIIAANFEKRSQQMINLVRNWFKKLEEWQ
ncbi:MAG: hypothetical protein QNJ38_12360 [Prochloraceae cyanobacterium]|nr:hypothetical protein [Prochloraceae cyanobacterium]